MVGQGWGGRAGTEGGGVHREGGARTEGMTGGVGSQGGGRPGPEGMTGGRVHREGGGQDQRA